MATASLSMSSAKSSIKERYWVAVASKDHVANGVKQGIAQANHGKSSPMKRLSRGDKIIYYSSKKTYGKPEPYQMFTAIGEVIDDKPYEGVMSGDFQPIRRDIRYYKAHDAPIAPLIDSLTFIKDKNKWGYMFRFGFFEISKQDYETIFKKMRP
jgi:predicted RNA-binding protein